MMRSPTVMALLFAVSTSFALAPALGFAADKKAHEEQQISMDQLPDPVKATLQKESQGGTLGPVTQETEKGKTVYEAEIDKNGKKRFVHVAPDGKVLKHESAKKESREEHKETK